VLRALANAVDEYLWLRWRLSTRCLPLFHVKILWADTGYETSIRKSLLCDSATCRK
jgi:hypothetical protein